MVEPCRIPGHLGLTALVAPRPMGLVGVDKQFGRDLERVPEGPVEHAAILGRAALVVTSDVEERRCPDLAKLKDGRYPLVGGGFLPGEALHEGQREGGFVVDAPL